MIRLLKADVIASYANLEKYLTMRLVREIHVVIIIILIG